MWQVAQILFILSILIVLHELGHYLTARWFKVRAEKFYLFMDAGFSLFKKKIGDTEWGIGWLPIGGYVKLSGMMDESMDEEQLKSEPQPWEFRSKPAWQRLIILLGGIIVNLLVAFVIYTVMFSTYGKEYPATEKYQKEGLMFSEVGHKAGFKNGDKIVSVDGKFTNNFKRIVIDILLGDEVIVDRDGKNEKIILTTDLKRDILSNEGRNFILNRFAPIVDSITIESPLQKLNIKKGDQIIGLDSVKIKYFDELVTYLKAHKGDSASLQISRNNEILAVKTKISDSATLGFKPKLDNSHLFNNDKYSFFKAIPVALEESYTNLVYNVKQFKLILQPKTEAYKQVKSPIGIAASLPSFWDWHFVWNTMAFISIALAFMNLLPIPGLDGGHALFTIVEMIRGKPLSDKINGYIQTAGMVFLLSLMVILFGKDIYELIQENFLK